jgi:hypothetical protein
MPGQSGSETRRKTEVVNFRADADLVRKIDWEAERRGYLSRGWIVREIVEEHFLIEFGPVTGYKRNAKKPPIDVSAVKGLAGEIGKLNGSVRQLAQVVRESGNQDLHDQVEQTLAELKRMQRQVDTFVGTVQD